MDSTKDVVQSSVNVPEFDLKTAGGHIGRNVVEKTLKMKTVVRKPLMIKILLCSFHLVGCFVLRCIDAFHVI